MGDDRQVSGFSTCAVIGIGLIGASFALAAKKAGVVQRVVGVARRESTRALAEQVGAADETTPDPALAVQDADLVYLAVPVGAMADVMKAIADCLVPGALVTDAGSVKQGICRAAEELLPPHVHFVGGHPMAGSHQSGPAAARPDLFEGHVYFLVPTHLGGNHVLQRMCAVVQAIGSVPHIVNAAVHDRLLAATSHLPHLAASALMVAVCRLTGSPEQIARYSGAGLRDTTRIAQSSPQLWSDIFLSNGSEIARAARLACQILDELTAAIEARDAERLQTLLQEAHAARTALEGLRREVPGS